MIGQLAYRDALRVVAYRRIRYGGQYIIWPASGQTWCAYYRALDVIHGTDPDESPLGHDYRCPIHGRKNRTRQGVALT